MLDAITLERRGIPSAPIGVEQLVNSTGRGMARIQGFPDFPIATITHDLGSTYGVLHDEEVQGQSRQVASQVENIILGRW